MLMTFFTGLVGWAFYHVTQKLLGPARMAGRLYSQVRYPFNIREPRNTVKTTDRMGCSNPKPTKDTKTNHLTQDGEPFGKIRTVRFYHATQQRLRTRATIHTHLVCAL
jgi:hypothetical protein